MKKLILIIAMVAFATSASAGWLYDVASTSGWDKIPSKRIKIDARGTDLRGYVFEAPGNDDYVCVFVAGSNKGGPACYPKKKKK